MQGETLQYFASEPETEGKGRRKHLWIRKDLVANGDGEPLPKNICDSEESQMDMMPEPFQDDLEDVQEEMQVEEEEEIDEADLPGENPIRAIPPVKRTFGNKLLEMLEANPGMLRSKQKPQESYMSFFFKKINPERSPPAFDQAVKCSDQSVDRQNDLKSPQQPNVESEPIIQTEQTSANGKNISEPDDLCKGSEANEMDSNSDVELVEKITVANEEVSASTIAVAEKEAEVIDDVERESVSSENTLEECKEKENGEPPLEINSPRRYKRGPKSKKRFLEIKSNPVSPKKVKVVDPLLEEFQTNMTLEEFKKAKEAKNGETNLAFKLFKVWFKQLDSEANTCKECGKVCFNIIFTFK